MIDGNKSRRKIQHLNPNQVDFIYKRAKACMRREGGKGEINEGLKKRIGS